MEIFNDQHMAQNGYLHFEDTLRTACFIRELLLCEAINYEKYSDFIIIILNSVATDASSLNIKCFHTMATFIHPQLDGEISYGINFLILVLIKMLEKKTQKNSLEYVLTREKFAPPTYLDGYLKNIEAGIKNEAIFNVRKVQRDEFSQSAEKIVNTIKRLKRKNFEDLLEVITGIQKVYPVTKTRVGGLMLEQIFFELYIKIERNYDWRAVENLSFLATFLYDQSMYEFDDMLKVFMQYLNKCSDPAETDLKKVHKEGIEFAEDVNRMSVEENFLNIKFRIIDNSEDDEESSDSDEESDEIDSKNPFIMDIDSYSEISYNSYDYDDSFDESCDSEEDNEKLNKIHSKKRKYEEISTASDQSSRSPDRKRQCSTSDESSDDYDREKFQQEYFKLKEQERKPYLREYYHKIYNSKKMTMCKPKHEKYRKKLKFAAIFLQMLNIINHRKDFTKFKEYYETLGKEYENYPSNLKQILRSLDRFSFDIKDEEDIDVIDYFGNDPFTNEEPEYATENLFDCAISEPIKNVNRFKRSMLDGEKKSESGSYINFLRIVCEGRFEKAFTTREYTPKEMVGMVRVISILYNQKKTSKTFFVSCAEKVIELCLKEQTNLNLLCLKYLVANSIKFMIKYRNINKEFIVKAIETLQKYREQMERAYASYGMTDEQLDKLTY